jgi:hypothetical protein
MTRAYRQLAMTLLKNCSVQHNPAFPVLSEVRLFAKHFEMMYLVGFLACQFRSN